VTGAVFLALAVIVGVGSAVLAWSQVCRATTPTKGDPAALAVALRRVPAGTRLRELQRRAERGSWEHELAVEALDTPDEPARVAVVNLALAEVEHRLSEGADWPRTSLRIALLGAALLAFIARIVDRDQSRWSLAILAVGGLAALSCLEARRSAERHAAKQRRAVDDLVAAVFSDGLRARGLGRGALIATRALERRARWRTRRAP
jgi:hypothetical protein